MFFPGGGSPTLQGRLLPASVPFRYFGAAAVFHCAAWLALYAGRESIPSQGGGFGPGLAALHLFTLGVLVMTAIGASLQLLPIATRQPVVSVRAAKAVWWLLTPGVALLLALYARGYFAPGDQAAHHFWPLAGFLLAGMNALFLAADLFNLYVTLELVGLAAVGLVASGGGAAQLGAALRYLFATLLGSGAYLLGVALVYGAYGTVSIELLLPLVDADVPRAVWFAAALMLAGVERRYR